MKTERMLKFADFIEKLPHHPSLALVAEIIPGQTFNMNNWHTTEKTREGECGTICCIAGWTVLNYGSADEIATLEKTISYVEHTAARLLDLDRDVAMDLFLGNFEHRGDQISDITPTEAAAAIRQLALEHEGKADG